MGTSETPSHSMRGGPPPPPSSLTNKLNMVDCSISVDTKAANFVDIPQQDSGSNQSGSDSGLGYTNSISSDNNSILNAPVGQDQTSVTSSTITTTGLSHNGGSSSSCINDGISAVSRGGGFASSTSFRSNSDINAGLSFNNAKHNKTNDSLASLCTVNARREVGELGETRTKPDEVLNKQTTSTLIRNNHHETAGTEAKAVVDAGSSAGNNNNNNNELVPSQTVPVIKSLLKKSSRSISGGTAGPKHNRKVSFNQTVIVFCEEIGAVSPVEQFEPPLAYQDTLGAFEPPENYCEHESERNKENLSHTNGADGNGRHRRTDGDDTNNLTDEQILGLLENDSLLDTFKLNCDDLSEEDFPVNHLNSDRSYLCNDAISDYDSDSESSYCIDRRGEFQPPQTSAGTIRNQNEIRNSTEAPHSLKKSGIEGTGTITVPDHKYNRCHESRLEPTKSMPARMKVTTLDQSQLKRQVNREDENDLKSKVKTHHNITDSDEKGIGNPSNQDLTLTPPMLIKQSNVEPVNLNKPKLLARERIPSNQPLPDAAPKYNPNQKTSSCSTYSVPKSISSHHQNNPVTSRENSSNHLSQSSTNSASVSNDNQTNVQSCHACKIESNKSKSQREITNLATRENNLDAPVTLHQQGIPVVQANQLQPIKHLPNQPPIYSQSCISCREASVANGGMQTRPTVGVQQSPRPVAYQLVYVVDQNGNRMKALSMIRPGQIGLPTPERRIFVAQNSIRFPNPVSISSQSVNNPSNKVHQLPVNQNLVLGNNAQQSDAKAQTTQPSQGYYLHYPDGTIKTCTAPFNPNIGAKQHRVYYVRQPLDTHNILQSSNSPGSITRSFPDPHEIRRLDGLKGPTAALNLGGHPDQDSYYRFLNQNPGVCYQQQKSGDFAKRVTDMTRDDIDDPTFGFSKRPSVKVVTANSTICKGDTLNNRLKSGNINFDTSNAQPGDIIAIRRITDQSGNIRPVSFVVMGSQTLDRRHINQQSQNTKENLPSTSSMSNLHGVLVNNSNRVMTNMSQQQRISINQIMDARPENRTKEFTVNKFDDVCPKSNQGETASNRVAFLTAKGRQISSLNGNDVPPEQHRKAQDQTEVIYTLDI